MALDNRRVSVILEQVMGILDQQSGRRRPWRSTRFNNLYAVRDDDLTQESGNYAFYFSGRWKYIRSNEDGQPLLSTSRLGVSENTATIYIRMFHCMVYLCSLSFKPWNAWLVLHNSETDKIDDTKRMQTFVRRYMASLQEYDRLHDDDTWYHFIADYIYDRGPVYDPELGKLVLLPMPERTEEEDPILNQLKLIITEDKGPDPTPHPNYIIIPSRLMFDDNSAQSSVIGVESNIAWKFSGTTGDCRVQPDEGVANANVTVSVSENQSEQERQWTLTVSDISGGSGQPADSKTLVVRQAGKEIVIPQLSVSPVNIEHNYTSGQVSLILLSTVPWSVNSGNFPNWLQLNHTSGTTNKLLKLKFVTENSTDADRTFTLVFTGQGVSNVNVSVKQTKSESGGNVLTVSPDVLSGLSKTGATATFNVRSNVSWVAASSESWCTISPSSGSGSGDTIVETAVTVTVSANSGPQRTATITVSGTDVTAKTVSVQQYGESTQHSLNIYPESLTLDHTYHSETFTYDSTDNWQADSPVSWCYFGSGETHINGYSGSGTFIVNLIANDTGTNRSCTLSFQSDFVTKQVNVLQYAEGGGGNYLRTNVTYITLDSNAQSSNVSVESNVAWVADVLADGETRTLSVDQTSVSGEGIGGTATVNVTSDTIWSVRSNKEWLTVSPEVGNPDVTSIVLTFSQNPSTTDSRSAVVTISGAGATDVTVTLTQEANPAAQHYTVGLISDIHYCVTENRQITTESPGNSSSEYGYNSFFRQDLNKLIAEFKNAGVEFVASTGDIATYDVNDFVEFSRDYIKDFTGIDTYSGTSFLDNADYRPFYCAMGNHDHFINYADNSLCKYINYGVADAGSRWKTITYNGTVYNCPEQLAGTGITYAPNSKSYKVTHGSDIFLFIQANYGGTLVPNNPNYSASSKNDMSQMHPHNQLDSGNADVQAMMSYCGKTDIFSSSTESHFNFQYFLPSDLIWLKNEIQGNTLGRSFVFMHYFFPQKAGGGNIYDLGSTEMMGLTFYFLNKLNNDYPKTVWFSGHSHYSWKENSYGVWGDIHFCNKDYAPITPNSKENQTITHLYNGSNWFTTFDESVDAQGDKVYPKSERHKLYNRTGDAVRNGTGWNVHLPSMSRPKIGSTKMANCEAAIMDIYGDHVEIRKIGFESSDGVNYTSYSNSIYYSTLNISSTGAGTISGPVPGGGTGSPLGGADRNIYILVSIKKASGSQDINSHVRLEFTDGTYLHMYRTGSAESGAAYVGKQNKYTASYTLDNQIVFVNSIPDKFRYLCRDYGLAMVEPDAAKISEFGYYYYDGNLGEKKVGFYGGSTGSASDLSAQWITGDDQKQLIDLLVDVLDNYQGRTLKNTVKVYYYDSALNEQSVDGTLDSVCYYDETTEYDTGGLYFLNGMGSAMESRYFVKYNITI